MDRQIDPFAQRLIRHKVRQLIGKYGFTSFDCDDLKQDLLLHVLQKLHSHGDQITNRQAFLATIIEQRVASLIRRRRSGKGNAKKLRSLQTLVQDEDQRWVPFSEIIPAEQGFARLAVEARSDYEEVDLRHDVAAVLAKLPEDLRLICEHLKHFSVAATARRLGLPRTTINDALQRLRNIFRESGLGNFFQNHPSLGQEKASEELIEGHSQQQLS